jgi:hypothetical protein
MNVPKKNAVNIKALTNLSTNVPIVANTNSVYDTKHNAFKYANTSYFEYDFGNGFASPYQGEFADINREVYLNAKNRFSGDLFGNNNHLMTNIIVYDFDKTTILPNIFGDDKP